MQNGLQPKQVMTLKCIPKDIHPLLKKLWQFARTPASGEVIMTFQKTFLRLVQTQDGGEDMGFWHKGNRGLRCGTLFCPGDDDHPCFL